MPSGNRGYAPEQSVRAQPPSPPYCTNSWLTPADTLCLLFIPLPLELTRASADTPCSIHLFIGSHIGSLSTTHMKYCSILTRSLTGTIPCFLCPRRASLTRLLGTAL